MLLGLAVLLLLFWLFGLGLHIAGGFIHIALVLALIVAVAHFIRGRRAAV